MNKIIWLVCFLFLFSASPIFGQSLLSRWFMTKPDTNYVKNNQHDLILRIYASQKYSEQNLLDRRQNINLKYRPSNGYVLGFGFNYKFLGINIGTILPFARPDVENFGKTKYLDFQSHMYLRFLTVDFYTGYYKGMYLKNSSEVIPGYINSTKHYIRPDIRTYSGGFGLYANLNPAKFTIRAPFLQNEYQKRSAGQPMLGLETYWVGSSADSSFIPAAIEKPALFNGVKFNRWEFISANLTGGYAYTLVMGKRWFLMGGVNLSLGVGRYELFPIGSSRMTTVSPNISMNQKFGAGYHFDRLFVGLSWANFQYFTPTAIDRCYIRWGTGNLRFNVAYRFSLKKDYELRPWKWIKTSHDRS